MTLSTRWCATIAAWSLLSIGTAHAQEEPDYLFPDLAPDALDHHGDSFWSRPIFAIVPDYTFFDQDDASLMQVDKQDDSPDIRAARFGLNFRSTSDWKWDAFIAFDYEEKRTREEDVLQVFDFKFGMPLGPARINFGKQKEPHVLEMVGLSIQNPQQERILNPFFVTRSIGVQMTGQLAGDRMTWAAGWYNDWLETDFSFSENADDYVGRLTGLVYASSDDRNFLHLGGGFRRVGNDAGTMRYSGRPSSNVADKYIDTGDFPANDSLQLSIEAAWNRGPFALIGEHVRADVDAPEVGDPQFSGTYLTMSWILTGEGRRYKRPVGFIGGIVPERRTGAWEIVIRYGHLDFTDADIDGGVLDHWYYGLNWWTAEQWKVGASWGDADLDKGGLKGNTKILLFRIQWLYGA